MDDNNVNPAVQTNDDAAPPLLPRLPLTRLLLPRLWSIPESRRYCCTRRSYGRQRRGSAEPGCQY